MTAFYRLGVGINSAFTAMREYGDMLESINRHGASDLFDHGDEHKILNEIVSAHETKTSKRVEALVQFQLSIMVLGE